MRLDKYMVETFFKTRSQAQDLIRQGKVSVNNRIVTKTGYELKGEEVQIIKDMDYVSRGGLKLKDAIDSFKLNVKDAIMADIGSSTGGFTDCALKEGVSHVYAYDVGTDQMDQSLRSNPKVSLFEQTNILDVTLNPNINLFTVDVSFTSVKPILLHLMNTSGLYVVLVKPQFEVGPKHLKNGIVIDLKKQKEALEGIIEYANDLGFKTIGSKKSDLKGKMGNQEYLLILKK
ncbi:MAG: TlyA family RNA methyltransferase [Acholeplasma sp.]|nr:TlyA family RNA methyltransferase [Acholeplasma sp.]